MTWDPLTSLASDVIYLFVNSIFWASLSCYFEWCSKVKLTVNTTLLRIIIHWVGTEYMAVSIKRTTLLIPSCTAVMPSADPGSKHISSHSSQVQQRNSTHHNELLMSLFPASPSALHSELFLYSCPTILRGKWCIAPLLGKRQVHMTGTIKTLSDFRQITNLW